MADRKLVVEIVGDDRQLSRTFDRASKNSKSFGKDIERVGRGAAVATVGFRGLGRSIAFASGAFLGGAGFVAGSKAIVNAASDLNEQVNKSTVVFGDSAAAIQAWSKTTAGALGLSQRAALEAAGGFGQLLQTAGLTEPVAAQFSKTLVGLAADLASFNNIDPSEALLKLKSGLAGEAEPLRTVGVLLSEARVKQEAYASGIAKAGAELTEGQKVQARYNLILKDTAKQQGDFARTSDSFANAQRIVRANFENLAAQIGEKVLPAIARATTAFGGFLTKLTEARGARAKLDVVLEAGENLLEQGRKVAEQIRTSVGQALREIDWRELGKDISRGLSAAVEDIAAFVRNVDWAVVGTAVVRGIADFLKGVDWVGLFKSIVRLWVAALKAQANLLIGAAEELAGQLKDALTSALERATIAVEKAVLKLVIKLLGAFGFLGRFNPFKGVVDKAKAALEDLEIRTAQFGEIAERAAVGTHGKGTTQAERDAAKTASAKAAVAQKVARDAQVKANAETDKADKAQLQKEADAAKAKAKKLKEQADALARKQIEDEKKRRQAVIAARKAAQFEALGLTEAGETRTPGSGSLLKRARSLQAQIKGTSLDTDKTREQLRRIISVLKKNFKTAGKDVRAAILEMLNDISSALEGKGPGAKKGPLTSTHGLATAQIIKNLGLTVEQAEEIQRRLAHATTGGGISRAIGGGTATLPRGGFGQMPVAVVSHTNLYLDGTQIASVVTRQQQKAKRRNPRQKRGPNRR